MPETQNTKLDFETLPAYQPRAFVPKDADLRDKGQVTALYQKLLKRSIQSSEDLDQWLKDRGELQAAVDQQGSLLYVRMTCQTDDKQRAADYKHFLENVIPAIKPLEDRLDRQYLKAREQFQLDEAFYAVYNRETRSDVELFREENVALQTKEALLAQEYQTICGTMTVNFEGKERTLPQMQTYQLVADRAVRESAWHAVAKRRLEDKDRLDDIFDQMLKLRCQIAANAGCSNFCEYQFRAYHRFDYTPQDCKTYHEAAKKCIVDLWAEILQKRRAALKVERLKPWDLAVDPQGRPPLKPFEQSAQLITGVAEMFKRTDSELGEQFAEMARLGLLDLDSRKGKAPGGYQTNFAEIRKPFIFMNAVGVDQDIRTLLHEGGHAFHSFACRDQSLYDYRHGPMEFNEVASMAMELLAEEQMDVFYNEEDKRRSRAEHLKDIVWTLVWVATVDAFQHWIYENPKHNREERADVWIKFFRAFNGGVVDYSGLEEAERFLWHRQLHIFEVPFYYIEYAIAQLGALQIWRNAKTDPAKALSDYRKGLALGGSRPIPELYKAAGITFDFSENTIAPLVEEVKIEINNLVN